VVIEALGGKMISSPEGDLLPEDKGGRIPKRGEIEGVNQRRLHVHPHGDHELGSRRGDTRLPDLSASPDRLQGYFVTHQAVQDRVEGVDRVTPGSVIVHPEGGLLQERVKLLLGVVGASIGIAPSVDVPAVSRPPIGCSAPPSLSAIFDVLRNNRTIFVPLFVKKQKFQFKSSFI
jgi:hypothetical protein